MTTKNLKSLRQTIEKDIERAKDVKFISCLVCLKKFPKKQSDTIRYCSIKCSDIAMRVRQWENNRGMNLRECKAKLQLLDEVEKIINELRKKHTMAHTGCGDPSECCFNGWNILNEDKFFEDLFGISDNKEGAKA